MTERQLEQLQGKLVIYKSRVQDLEKAVRFGYAISRISHLVEERDVWANDIATFLLSIHEEQNNDLNSTD